MPLQDGDIEILDIRDRSLPGPGNKLLPVKDIMFRVRGGSAEHVYIPREVFTRSVGEAAVVRAATEIVDLLDAYPVKD